MTKFGATRCGCFSGWILTTLQPCREVMKSYTSTNEMFGVDVRVLFCTLYCLPTQQDQTWQGLNSLVRLWVPVACCTTHDRAGDQEQSNVFTMWGFSLERNGVPEKNHAEVWINPFVGNADQAVEWLKISPKRQTNFADIGSLLRGKAVRQEHLNSTDCTHNLHTSAVRGTGTQLLKPYWTVFADRTTDDRDMTAGITYIMSGPSISQRRLSLHLTVAAIKQPRKQLSTESLLLDMFFCPKHVLRSCCHKQLDSGRTKPPENVYDVLKCRLKLGSSTSMYIPQSLSLAESAASLLHSLL